MNTCRLFVVIPTRNRSGFIINQIRNFQPIVEQFSQVHLVIVDDNSDPFHKEVLSELNDRYEMINFLFLEQRLGAPAARNLGVSNFQVNNKDWVWFLDDDDLITQNHLFELLVILHQINGSERVVLLSSKTNGIVIHPITFDLNKTYRSKGQDVNTSCLIIRYEFFKEIGGWDEKLVAGQDTDLFLRISQKVDRVIGVNNILIHRDISGNDRITKSVLRQMRGKYQFVTKHWKNLSYTRLLRYILTLVLCVPFWKRIFIRRGNNV